MSAKNYRIGVIGGDGTGPEVISEGIKVIGAAEKEIRLQDRLGQV